MDGIWASGRGPDVVQAPTHGFRFCPPYPAQSPRRVPATRAIPLPALAIARTWAGEALPKACSQPQRNAKPTRFGLKRFDPKIALGETNHRSASGRAQLIGNLLAERVAAQSGSFLGCEHPPIEVGLRRFHCSGPTGVSGMPAR